MVISLFQFTGSDNLGEAYSHSAERIFVGHWRHHSASLVRESHTLVARLFFTGPSPHDESVATSRTSHRSISGRPLALRRWLVRKFRTLCTGGCLRHNNSNVARYHQPLRTPCIICSSCGWRHSALWWWPESIRYYDRSGGCVRCITSKLAPTHQLI